MTYIDDAVEWIRQLPGERPDLFAVGDEIGCALWRDRDEQFVRPDTRTELITGSIDRIRLYPPDVSEKVLATTYLGKGPELWFGDFHSHPETNTWAGQFPSPQDLLDGRFSVLKDYYVLAEPVNDVTDIPLRPEMQAVLLVALERVLVFMPTDSRAQYEDARAQEAEIATLRARYAKWHRAADSEYGAFSSVSPASGDVAVLARAVAEVDELLGSRVSCEMR